MDKGMTLIVKTVTRLVLTFVFVFAIAIALYGHVTPGGGFAGGAILACGLILMLLAFGREEAFAVLSKEGASVWDCLGALAFLAIAFLGLRGGNFFLNFLSKGESFRLLSSGTVLWSNVAIFIKVGACLYAVYVVLAAFRMSDKE